MIFDENKHPRDEQGKFTNKNKIYTDENYQEFHNLFYGDSDKKGDVYIKKQKGDSYYIDEKIQDNQSRLSNLTHSGLEKLLENKNIIKVKLPNKKQKGKENLIEDTQTIQKFQDLGFEIKAQYNDGYDTSFVMQKEKQGYTINLLDEIKNIKLEKYKPTKYYIDWGKQKHQGKRTGGMITGAMGDISLQGIKEYTNILGGFTEKEQNEAKELFRQDYEQKLYAQAREYGLNQEKAEKFVLSVFNSYTTQTTRLELGNKY